MKYIGIDVSSQVLNIHIAKGELGQDFEIENSPQAIKAFVKTNNISPKNCLVGAESTGKYHFVCMGYFVRQGFQFKLLNPLLTGKAIQNTIRKKKTDKSDAQLIVKLLKDGEGQLINVDNLKNTKKTLLRTRRTVVQHTSSMKLLYKQLKNEEQCEEIKKTMIQLNKLIKKMEETAKEIENTALHEEQTEDEKYIESIPGFGTNLAAIVASETGDFNRFPSARQFKAYVGIDPKVKQSGESRTTGKITKRGNAMLRSAFYIAAQVARQHDPNLKAYFEKKISEGKHFNVAICAVARKLCERVYAIVTKKIFYEIRQAV